VKSTTQIMKKNEPLNNNQPSMSLIEVLTMIDQLNNFYSNDCNDCGNERTLVEFEDLPYFTRQIFTELIKMPEYKNGVIHLYCKRCDQHSMLGNPYKR